MATPLPDASALCVDLYAGTNEVCIEFPGGTRICAQKLHMGDPAEIVRDLFGQANAAMAGLTPIFNILDVVQAIADCVQAIPDFITDPTKLINCIPGMVEALNKLLAMAPPLSIPLFIKSLLQAIIIYLQGLRRELESMIAALARVIRAETRAAELGNVHFDFAVGCSRDDLDAQFAYLNAGVDPLKRLIGLINVFLKLANLPCLQIPLDPFVALSEDILAGLDAAIEFLIAFKNAIPVPDLLLEALPQKGDPCD